MRKINYLKIYEKDVKLILYIIIFYQDIKDYFTTNIY